MDLILIILITILFSAFFSGMEIAYVSANKFRLELEKKNQSVSSRILTVFTKKPGQYIATMLVGNNIALVIYGIAFAKLLEPILQTFISTDSLVLIIQTIISTLIILVSAEFLPKTLFQINSNAVLKFFSLPLILFYYLFYPISKFSMSVSKFLIRGIFHEKFDEDNEANVFSRVELDHFVKDSNDDEVQVEEDIENEVKLFRNALDFSKVKLREIMVPRTEIEALDINSSMSELTQKLIETGYSRILFYEENIDNIIGYLHHSVIFTNPDSIRSNLRNVLIVPETMSANKLLSKFIQQHRTIAIVVDEFGGTAGIVTSEDIMEEIFGEIEDEHDTSDLTDRKISPNEFMFSARMEIDDINDKYNLELPSNDNYETLAGFILFHHESIPKINSNIVIDKFKFKILEASNTKIELVNLKILDNI